MAASILVVDDDPALVQLMGAMLADLARVRFAMSGEAALRQIALERPDLILLDSEMPRMGGFEVCRTVRSSGELDDIPIIFVTMHSDQHFEARCLEAGAVDFIRKPVSRLLLRARVQTHLRLKHALDTIRRTALTDSLTGLSNRHAFDTQLDREFRHAVREDKPLALLKIDVDCFKPYNDLYGYPAGDACLARVARALEQALRRPHDLVARYGGEEFAALLPETGVHGARAVGERMLQAVLALRIPHQRAAAGRAGFVSVSIGAASLSRDAAAGLVADADRALHAAKSAGRARLCVQECADSASTSVERVS